ncbi:hypothetical protein HIM_11597 [Hirsutella minnesotensis 3608]|uniref:Uncharacterized protein n=1 Tax=Hirsutella minnesotensis 3608 TaxID=1043627 RepID=A0A0F7ZR52_9HYPO|nr:hypothetical protein HIM_11597 [Hirsutella minnesotensis 3608]
MDTREGSSQPNFGMISGSFDALSQQFALCGNLPAVDSGTRLVERMDAVLEQLTLLNRKVDGLDRKVDRLDRKVNGLDGRMDDLDRKITVTNKNFTARMQNSIVIHDKVDLEPLYSVRTGEVIPDCPETLQDLLDVDSQVASDILRELDESVPRNQDVRKQRLKHAFGVRSRAT